MALVVITGASRGIGRAIAIHAARTRTGEIAPDILVLCARDPLALAAVRDECAAAAAAANESLGATTTHHFSQQQRQQQRQQEGTEGTTIHNGDHLSLQLIVWPLDVTDPEACTALLKALPRAPDMLILCAGVSAHEPFLLQPSAEPSNILVNDDSRTDQTATEDISGSVTTDPWPDALSRHQKIMDVNHFGVVNMLGIFLPAMLDRGPSVDASQLGGKRAKTRKGQPRVTIVGSVSGVLGLPLRSAYCASKFALRGLVESLRCEFIPSELSLTLVNPSSVATDMRDHQLAPADGAYDVEFNEDPAKRMPVSACAVAIWRSAERRDSEVHLSWSGAVGSVLQPTFPEVTRWAAVRKAGGKVTSKL